MRLVPIIVAAALLALCGCGNQLDSGSTKAVLTEHQRDSVLARSGLPGADVVGRALQQSDRATHRAADMDSLTR